MWKREGYSIQIHPEKFSDTSQVQRGDQSLRHSQMGMADATVWICIRPGHAENFTFLTKLKMVYMKPV